MFGGHFYHAILRKTVTVFGTLFNNITIVRKTSGGDVADYQKVPLAYGPKQKFLSRLDDQNDLEGTKVALKLPRMSFEITGMTYDSTTKLSPYNRLTTSQTATSKTSVATSVPYVLDMELNIMAKNQDDALQIMEQILPFFQPAYNVSVKFIDNIENSFDMPVTLQSVSMTDDYEGDYTTRRVLIYTLTFSVKTRFFSGTNTSSIIRQVDTNLYKQDPDGFLENIHTEVNPPGATPATAGEPTQTFRLVASTDTFIIRDALGSAKVSYTINQSVYASTSGTQAVVKDYEYDSVNLQNILTVTFADGFFIAGEDIVNPISSQWITMKSIETV